MVVVGHARACHHEGIQRDHSVPRFSINRFCSRSTRFLTPLEARGYFRVHLAQRGAGGLPSPSAPPAIGRAAAGRRGLAICEFGGPPRRLRRRRRYWLALEELRSQYCESAISGSSDVSARSCGMVSSAAHILALHVAMPRSNRPLASRGGKVYADSRDHAPAAHGAAGSRGLVLPRSSGSPARGHRERRPRFVGVGNCRARRAAHGGIGFWLGSKANRHGGGSPPRLRRRRFLDDRGGAAIRGSIVGLGAADARLRLPVGRIGLRLAALGDAGLGTGGGPPGGGRGAGSGATRTAEALLELPVAVLQLPRSWPVRCPATDSRAAGSAFQVGIIGCAKALAEAKASIAARAAPGYRMKSGNDIFALTTG